MKISGRYYIYIMLLIVNGSFLVHSLEKNFTDKSANIKENPQISAVEEETSSEPTEMYNLTKEAEEELALCVAVFLRPEYYTIFPNQTVFVEVFNKTYDPGSYRLDEDEILVCPPKFKDNDGDNEQKLKFDHSFALITRIGLGISMLCLLMHLIVFFAIPDMRNLPGCNLASLSFSLFFGYLFLQVGNISIVRVSRIPCICVAAGIHFFMLSSILWMSSMSFDVLRSLLRATGKLRLPSTKFRRKNYVIYSLYSWGTSLLFVVVTLMVDHVEGVPDGLRPMYGTEGVCWFNGKDALTIFFASPVITVIIFNAIFFGASAYIIYTNRMKVHGDEAYKDVLKRNALMHGRLATIMGLSWLTAIIANAVNTTWLWYIFTLTNTLQGIFIFLGFSCTEKVKKQIIAKLESRKRKKSTTQPTFLSHCNSVL